ncbi:hypothetical protein GC207_08045 [bacterium]|nr:hypothetical protein [bacterium]
MLSIVTFSCVAFLTLVIVGTWVLTRSLKPKGKAVIFCASVATAIGLIWTAVTLLQSVSSGGLLRQYCRGFAETVRSKLPEKQLNEVFADILRSQNEQSGEEIKLDSNSPFKQIFPQFRPKLFTLMPSGQKTKTVVALWECAGGAFGLVYGDVPLPHRSWLDQSLKLGEHVWVVARSE